MSEFVPLLQTLLWVGLIVWLVVRYNKQVSAVLAAIEDRIAHGSSLKAGPFELGQDIRPQDIQEQNKRIEEEVQQLQPIPNQALPAPTPEITRRAGASARRRYLLAEDLVMRELQSEFGAVIKRSIRFENIELDGLFAKDSKGFGIEVKYVRDRVRFDRVPSSLSRVYQGLKRLGWDRFTLILALVCETDDAVAPSDLERIQNHATENGITLMIRTYTLQALAEKFSIELPNTDNS